MGFQAGRKHVHLAEDSAQDALLVDSLTRTRPLMDLRCSALLAVCAALLFSSGDGFRVESGVAEAGAFCLCENDLGYGCTFEPTAGVLGIRACHLSVVDLKAERC